MSWGPLPLDEVFIGDSFDGPRVNGWAGNKDKGRSVLCCVSDVEIPDVLSRVHKITWRRGGYKRLKAMAKVPMS